MNNNETIEKLLEFTKTATQKRKKKGKMVDCKLTITDWEDIAVRWFNRSVLAKNAELGICKCITCGKPYAITDGNMQAGHYVENCYTAGKFDYDNVDPQCVGCNMFAKGNKVLHFLAKAGQVGAKNMEKFILDRRTTKERMGVMKYIEIFYDSYLVVNRAREEGKTGDISKWTLNKIEKQLLNIIENE